MAPRAGTALTTLGRVKDATCRADTGTKARGGRTEDEVADERPQHPDHHAVPHAPTGVEQVTLHPDRQEIVVHTTEGGEITVDLSCHREDVVRRLLSRGVSAGTLQALLPDWAPLIARLAGGNGQR